MLLGENGHNDTFIFAMFVVARKVFEHSLEGNIGTKCIQIVKVFMCCQCHRLIVGALKCCLTFAEGASPDYHFNSTSGHRST